MRPAPAAWRTSTATPHSPPSAPSLGPSVPSRRETTSAISDETMRSQKGTTSDLTRTFRSSSSCAAAPSMPLSEASPPPAPPPPPVRRFFRMAKAWGAARMEKAERALQREWFALRFVHVIVMPISTHPPRGPSSPKFHFLHLRRRCPSPDPSRPAAAPDAGRGRGGPCAPSSLRLEFCSFRPAQIVPGPAPPCTRHTKRRTKG